jgi:hypothetical protein
LLITLIGFFAMIASPVFVLSGGPAGPPLLFG